LFFTSLKRDASQKVLDNTQFTGEKSMQLIISKATTTSAQVRNHEMFGKAVFIECGLHDPLNYCYDHHDGDSAVRLSACEMVHQEIMLGRKLPNITVMNAVRGFDNLLALYVLWNRQLARTPETTKFVYTAGIIDRIGPSAVPSLDQTTVAVINTAQEVIPWKEQDVSEEDLHRLGLQAVESLRRMVTRPGDVVEYQIIEDLGEFLVAYSEKPVQNTFYNQGYRAYGVYTTLQNGNTKWTLARLSEYVTEFDMPSAFEELNLLEAEALKCTVEELKTKKAFWSGRGAIGGSPFNVGTVLSVEVVTQVLKKHWNSN
jgi:hypothetical protein